MATPTVNEVVADNVTLHTLNLMRADAGTRRTVLSILNKLDKDLAVLLKDSGITEFKKARLNALKRMANAMIESAYAEVTTQMELDMFGVASAEGRSAVRGINGAVGVDLATVYIAPATLKVLSKDAMLQGATNAEWWNRQSKAMQRRFLDTVRMGILEGQTNFQIVRSVINNVFPWERRNAEAIVRTAVQTVANDVRYQTYQYNSSVVKGVQSLVTFDTRTSHLCKSRSAMAWKLDGTPMNAATNISFPGPPPWHWNCRTTLTAVLKSWEELGSSKKIKEIEPGVRSSMNGQVSADQSYDDWLKKLPADDQIAALGPGRYKLFKDGNLKLRDLVDQTGRELTIPELEALS